MGKKKAKRKSRVVDMLFPGLGLDTSQAQFEQPPGTTPDCRNVRVFDQENEMARGGQRGGLARAFTRGENSFCQSMVGFSVVVQDDA